MFFHTNLRKYLVFKTISYCIFILFIYFVFLKILGIFIFNPLEFYITLKDEVSLFKLNFFVINKLVYFFKGIFWSGSLISNFYNIFILGIFKVFFFIWYFVFDQFFFFFYEFFQNPGLLLYQLIYILFGSTFIKFKYILVLNYYYYFFVPNIWINEEVWSFLIYNFNIWPNDIRSSFLFLFLMVVFQFFLSILYFLPKIINIFNYLSLIKLNLFYYNFIFSIYNIIKVALVKFFYIRLTNFYSLNKIYFKTRYPYFFKKYILKCIGVLEMFGLSIIFSKKKNNAIITKPGRFVGESYIPYEQSNELRKSIWILNNIKLFLKSNYKYYYYPLNAYQFKNSLFSFIGAEVSYKKYLLGYNTKVTSDIKPHFYDLRNVIIPLIHTTITINFKELIKYLKN